MGSWIAPSWRWYRARRWWWQGIIAIGLVFVGLIVLGSVLPSDDEQGPTGSSARDKRVITIPPTSALPDSFAEEADYLEAMPEIATDWAQIFSDLGDLTTSAGSQPSLLFTSSWQSSVLDVLDEGKLLRSRITALKPSPRLTAAHQELVAGLDAQDGIDREMRAAITDINAGDIASATEHFESALQFTNELASHLDSATSLLTTP